MIGAYSAAVIAAEVPSGMFADLYGRKQAYLVSAAATFCSFIIMYFSHRLQVLIPGIIIFGFGTAFLSGSLDSLIIEDCVRRGGEEALPEASGALLVYQGSGIASGSLICAALPNDGSYLPHLAVRLSALLLSALLCAGFIQEGPRRGCEKRSFRGQAEAVASALKENGALQIVIFCIFGSSAGLFALETYWQPEFIGLITRQDYLLGILCAAGYGASLLGSFFAGRLRLTKAKRRWRCYLICSALAGCGLMALSLQGKAAGFMLCYTVIMALLGAANVPEQTILNSESSDGIRASVLSAASLASKLSGIFSSLICAALIVPLKVPGVWLLMGSLTLLAAAASVLWLRKSSSGLWQQKD